MKKWFVGKTVGALVAFKLRSGTQVVSAEGEIPDEDDDDDMNYWQLWVRDAETGRVIAGPLGGHTNLVIALDISPDGSILVSGSVDRSHFMGHHHLEEDPEEYPMWCTCH
jgi:WD40 repeat protein